MVQKGTYSENDPERGDSILSWQFVEEGLVTANVNSRKDGSRIAVLYLRFKDSAHNFAPLVSPPPTAEEKQAYFTTL